MTEKNNIQDIKISQISTDIVWMKEEISDIKNNHLSCIYKKLEDQKAWLIALLTSTILVLVGTILNLLR